MLGHINGPPESPWQPELPFPPAHNMVVVIGLWADISKPMTKTEVKNLQEI